MSEQEPSSSALTPFDALERLLSAAKGTPIYPYSIGPYQRLAADDAMIIRSALEEWEKYRSIVGVLMEDP